jgi:hypothetical protein
MVGGSATDIYKERTMMPLDNSRRDYVVLAVSLALAAVFTYAGIDKIRDPFINLLALSLPPFEVACGLLLFWAPTRRVGALAVSVISVVFFGALLSALLRGFTLDCGCFGIGAPSRPRMWLELALDVALFSGALFVYLRSITRLSTRAVNAPSIKA